MNKDAVPAWLTLLRDIARALTTREGRAIVREIACMLRRADEEAAEYDPIDADVDAAIARARRSDARRRAGLDPPKKRHPRARPNNKPGKTI